MIAAEDVVAFLEKGLHKLLPDALPRPFGDSKGFHGVSPFVFSNRYSPHDDGEKNALPALWEASLDALAKIAVLRFCLKFAFQPVIVQSVGSTFELYDD